MTGILLFHHYPNTTISLRCYVREQIDTNLPSFAGRTLELIPGSTLFFGPEWHVSRVGNWITTQTFLPSSPFCHRTTTPQHQ